MSFIPVFSLRPLLQAAGQTGLLRVPGFGTERDLPPLGSHLGSGSHSGTGALCCAWWPGFSGKGALRASGRRRVLPGKHSGCTTVRLQATERGEEVRSLHFTPPLPPPALPCSQGQQEEGGERPQTCSQPRSGCSLHGILRDLDRGTCTGGCLLQPQRRRGCVGSCGGCWGPSGTILSSSLTEAVATVQCPSSKASAFPLEDEEQGTC